MTEFHAFNRSLRLTAIVFVLIMLAVLFTRPADAQSNPYTLPPLDHCEPQRVVVRFYIGEEMRVTALLLRGNQRFALDLGDRACSKERINDQTIG